MLTLSLNDNWLVTDEPLYRTAEQFRTVLAKPDSEWMEAALPCDIHMPLIAAGRIQEPLVEAHTFGAEWTEKRSWWFKTEFHIEEAALAMDRIELTIESIDAHGDLFLNGQPLGQHRSAFYPCVREVRGMLQPGSNVLLVRVTLGVEEVHELDYDRFNSQIGMERAHNRGDRRRVAVRRPQYSFGWDWGPRVATCGIVGTASLTAYNKATIRSVSAVTASIEGDAATVQFEVEAERFHPYATADAEVVIEVRYAGNSGNIDNIGNVGNTSKTSNIGNTSNTSNIGNTSNVGNIGNVTNTDNVGHAGTGSTAGTADAAASSGSESGTAALRLCTELPLRSGLNYISLEGSISNPRLWWPNGMGDPYCYTVHATVISEGIRHEYPPFEFGIRTIALDQQRIADGERRFGFAVNGVPVFAKGANWIPADSIYARISDSKYAALVDDAREANFNMLRIWGGGIYERPAFYQACDRAGIMIWHDFMFACALYPDDLASFREEVSQEMDYQTRRLRNHPALALWCGNNEDHWGYGLRVDSGENAPYFGGSACYNELAPRIVHNNCPHIPYWNGSPYGGAHPNGASEGDCHYWHEAMMSPNMLQRITPEQYDRVDAKFVSEYGYIGPCSKRTIQRYHGEQPIERNGELWALHNNFYEKDTVNAGIELHYSDTSGSLLSLDDYLLYAGLCQGLMYGYSLEAFRYKAHCSGALFWMYNDCWGEIGWSIIDYYLDRKAAYHFVRRAFAPVKLIAREQDGLIRIIGINETARDIACPAEYGYIALDGSRRDTALCKLRLPARSRGEVLAFAKTAADAQVGCWFVQPQASAQAQADGGTANGAGGGIGGAAIGASGCKDEGSAGGGSEDNGNSSNSAGATAPQAIAPAILRCLPMKQLKLPEAYIEQSEPVRIGNSWEFTVSSRQYAHAVHFSLPEDVKLSDEYFDLLPGEARTLTIRDEAGLLDSLPMQAKSVRCKSV